MWIKISNKLLSVWILALVTFECWESFIDVLLDIFITSKYPPEAQPIHLCPLSRKSQKTLKKNWKKPWKILFFSLVLDFTKHNFCWEYPILFVTFVAKCWQRSWNRRDKLTTTNLAYVCSPCAYMASLWVLLYSKNMHVGLICDSKLAKKCEWFSVLLC